MTNFTTTRNGPPVGLTEAVLSGLAPDGGLYVPVERPRFTGDVSALVAAGSAATPVERFRAAAKWAGAALFPFVDETTLSRVIERALTFPVPLVQVEPGRFVLELFHGPTLAFKDVGARFMAALMEEIDRPPGSSRTVLAATSGDTGGAVAEAFHGRGGCRVIVLFPRDGISERQRRQMTTLGGNVHAVGVGGTFDDCQRLVKEAFAAPELAERHRLVSANSINIARLLPQAFYYVHAVVELSRAGGGEQILEPRFVVPSGNLGNLCAGLLAARAGLPTGGFTAATNENRVFVDFLRGRPFRPRASVATTSNAMDVGAPSNLERIRWLFDGEDDAIRAAVEGVSVDESSVFRRIADTYERTGYVLDPHSAVAFDASMRHDAASGPSIIVLATAHPAKFPQTVERAIGRPVPPPVELERRLTLAEGMVEMDPTMDSLSHLLDTLGP